MQSSDTATDVRVNCLYNILSQKRNARSKQIISLLFNLGEDLSCVVILRYKLCDLIKNYDYFVNDPVKRGVSEDFVTISDQQ